MFAMKSFTHNYALQNFRSENFEKKLINLHEITRSLN